MVSSSRPAAAAPASNQTACTITPADGASRSSAACACSLMARAQRRLVEPGDIDATQAVAGLHRHRAARSPGVHSSPSLRRASAQPQRIVMIEQRLQRRHQMILAQPRRHLQQHRLVEAVERPAALGAASA